MVLAPGDKLGPYQIISLIGKGGMGEVYCAHDARTGRDVAIKVSAERFNERFDREVRAVAALNHPNICQLYDVGENYLVMELVEGESPAGPLPLDDALRIARQIADALAAAHEKGVVHRDLKPGNIKIKSDGVVKVLDFGLAKVTSTPEARSGDSPTISLAETETGVILGTVAYMSPEQARGKPVDKRTDVWAFGVVLYELLTGKKPFRGDTMTDVLAAVVKEEPRWERVPAQCRRLLRKCLEKDTKDRLHDIADAFALVDEEPATGNAAHGRWAWLLAGALAIVAAIAVWAPWRTRPTAADPVRLEISLPESVTAADRNFVISPDGRKLAFNGVGSDGVARVWVRFMDSLEVRQLPGTETTPTAPPFFWSHDSRFIAYSAQGRQLKKVDLTGSPPQTLSETAGQNAPGGTWNREGVVLFGSAQAGLSRVSENGGMRAPVTVIDESRKETRHAFPTFLSDGRRFLYLRTSPSIPENSGVYLGSLDVKPEEQSTRRLVATLFYPVYVPSSEHGRGHLLIFRDGTVLAYTFDEKREEIVGDPVTVVQQVGWIVASAFFSASQNGILVYRSGGTSATRLLWYDRQGTYQANLDQPSGIRALALSPDGDRAAVVRQDPGNPDWGIWAWDTARGNSSRLTFSPRRADSPVWSPAEPYLVFASNRDGAFNLYRKLPNESKEDEALLKPGPDRAPTGFSRDGRLLLYTQLDPQTKNDVWVLSNPGGGAGDRRPTLLLNSESNETEARFSPESGTPRWIAYTSDITGSNQVYVREFSTNGRTWQVSTSGGSNPRWRGDGKELFFAAPDGTAMSVDIMPGATFQSSAPKVLFKHPAGMLPNWDVTADGKRLLLLSQVQQSTKAPFTVLLNWDAVLRK